jgi:hypothetical protein
MILLCQQAQAAKNGNCLLLALLKAIRENLMLSPSLRRPTWTDYGMLGMAKKSNQPYCSYMYQISPVGSSKIFALLNPDLGS